jgi:hypothetical protein
METQTSKAVATPKAEPPKPPAPSKAQIQAQRKALRYDRATIRAEIPKLRSSETTAEQKEQARNVICATVLRTTGLKARGADTVKAVSHLTSALLNDGNVGLFGIEEAAKMASSRIDVPAGDVDDILKRPEILERLNMLV